MHGLFFNQPIEKNYLGHQLSEIYKEGVYYPFFKNKKNSIVVDVGANIGVTTYYFSQRAKKVYAVEPSKEHFQVLKYMVQYNELQNVELFKQAMWIKSETGKLFHNKDNKTMYSLHTAVSTEKDMVEDVEMVTLDKFFDDNKIEHCDFLKLDVEGSEFEIIGGEGFRKVAPKIDVVFLEWHVWADRNPNQLKQALELNGFRVKVLESDAKLMVGVKDDKVQL